MHAENEQFKIDMVDRRFTCVNYPPVQPSNAGGGGGRSYNPDLSSPPPKKRQKLSEADGNLLDEM